MSDPDEAKDVFRASGADQSAGDQPTDEVADGEVVDGQAVDGELVDGELLDAELLDDTPDPTGARTDDARADPEPGRARQNGTAESVAAAGPAGSAQSSELTASIPTPSFDYTDQGVPTLNYVRDKIENRYGTALGSVELTDAGDVPEQQRAAAEERDRLAKEKLAELRRQLDGGTSES